MCAHNCPAGQTHYKSLQTVSEPPLSLQSRTRTPILCQIQICGVFLFLVRQRNSSLITSAHFTSNLWQICVSDVHFLQCWWLMSLVSYWAGLPLGKLKRQTLNCSKKQNQEPGMQLIIHLFKIVQSSKFQHSNREHLENTYLHQGFVLYYLVCPTWNPSNFSLNIVRTIDGKRSELIYAVSKNSLKLPGFVPLSKIQLLAKIHKNLSTIFFEMSCQQRTQHRWKH